MKTTLKILALIGCLLFMPVSNVFAQEQYEFDFNDDGTFEGTWDLGIVGEKVDIGIWLVLYECPPSDELFGAELYFGFDPVFLQVNGAHPNDSNHGGPFNPTFSSFIQQEPGVYLLTVANIDFVTVTNNKIKLGTIQLERIISGDTQIVASNDIGGLYMDGYIVDCNLASQYPSDATAIITNIGFCQGLADYDQDVDGTDAFMFKRHFGRSTFGNPCPPNGPAPVPKTGQTTSYATGDDGDMERGVVFPNPRFTDNGDGTVTDNLTGLIWLKNANCFETRSWNDALSDCNGLASGQCGLTDGSVAGDWRLPNKKELISLTHDGYYGPALSNTEGTGHWSEGNPFNNVRNNSYWSSTTTAFTGSAWILDMDLGGFNLKNKTDGGYVWPVRGGH